MVNYKSGLPKPVGTKIYKTCQTRGADKEQIFQNRVKRNSTVLIPFGSLNRGTIIPPVGFENDYIVLLTPQEYFRDLNRQLPNSLVLGINALVYYETRNDWNQYNPQTLGWNYATSRTNPLNGEYVARIPDTTRDNDSQIFLGFTGPTTGGQGAGIRVYEYASNSVIQSTLYQLAYLAWRTEGMIELAQAEGCVDIEEGKAHVDEFCRINGLDDVGLLEENRLLKDNVTICPLCLDTIRAEELMSRVDQAEGRLVPDLTITSVNLFHVKELRTGEYNHNIYNLGWGHHHCNTVARDNGIEPTIEWMATTLIRNGYTVE